MKSHLAATDETLIMAMLLSFPRPRRMPFSRGDTERRKASMAIRISILE
jgi:hypothetical protein